ncbi:hypothetical protein M5K25_014638 [Dendrobium thyrsiflorum]|uniref:Uncharacterized protein n=1 Tax=Dendrobium thyrsiflorum TaxID=117978 RepID=A0ABD0UV05_DENTH
MRLNGKKVLGLEKDLKLEKILIWEREEHALHNKIGGMVEIMTKAFKYNFLIFAACRSPVIIQQANSKKNEDLYQALTHRYYHDNFLLNFFLINLNLFSAIMVDKIFARGGAAPIATAPAVPTIIREFGLEVIYFDIWRDGAF